MSPFSLRPVALTTIHALTWLVVANTVGLLLATLLLIPEAGSLLGPLTYGRWLPLHLDLQLYGWCSLPLVGLLFHAYLPRRSHSGAAHLAVAAWSGSLLFGALTWLGGGSSGKLFLEWSGASRALFAGALGLLALLLAIGYRQRRREATPGEQEGPAVVIAKSALLASLFAVPPVLYWSASPEVYPSVNPDSGGPTGASLLGSTLGIVLVLCLIPLIAGLRQRRSTRGIVVTLVVLALHFALFAVLDHGDTSHHDLVQLLALFSLLPWLPLSVLYLRHFEWPAASRRWLLALAGWTTFLLVQAPATFLPGVLERFKFTNLLVGHAHLAMAGLVTSLDVVLLTLVLRDTALAGLFDRHRAFVMWQGGALTMIVALMLLGGLEAIDPGRLFHPDAATTVLYGVRWLAGASMWLASWSWLRRAVVLSRESVVVQSAPRASVESLPHEVAA